MPGPRKKKVYIVTVTARDALGEVVRQQRLIRAATAGQATTLLILDGTITAEEAKPEELVNLGRAAVSIEELPPPEDDQATNKQT